MQVQPDANVTEEEETRSEDEEQPIDVLDDNGVNEKDQMIRELREENKRLKVNS